VKVARILTRPNLGGPARQMVALWHAQRALGVRTLLLVGRCGPDETTLDLAAAGIPECRLAEVGRAPAGLEGFCVLPCLGRRIGALADLRALAALRRLLRRFDPDVVHTHTSKAGLLGRLAAPAGAVRAHTFHGLVLRDYAGPLRSAAAAFVERRLARRSELLFAVSASCRRELAEHGIGAPVAVVPPAVRTAAFAGADRAACRARLGGGRGPAIGFVGRLVPIKRPGLFVALARALPQVEAFVIGDGPLRGALERDAPPNLRWLGARADAADLLPGLDLLVLPSRREGFPVAAVEAAAAGIRTVGFAVPGLVDLAEFPGVARLVEDGSGLCGLLAATRDLLALGPPPAGPGAAELCALTDPPRVAGLLLDAYRRGLEERR
jgi:glycosyltransferase involved in cell wall biosynthesis